MEKGEEGWGREMRIWQRIKVTSRVCVVARWPIGLWSFWCCDGGIDTNGRYGRCKTLPLGVQIDLPQKIHTHIFSSLRESDTLDSLDVKCSPRREVKHLLSIKGVRCRQKESQ